MTLEDDDLLTAFQARWQADASLPSLVPGGLRAGVLESGKDTVPEQQQTQVCYATIASEPGKAGVVSAPVRAGDHYIDFRKVTLTVYGLKADVVRAAGAVRSAFEWQPKTPAAGSETIPQTGPRLDVPNADLLSCVPLPGSNALKPAGPKRGKDIYSWQAMYEVACDREIP